MRGLLKKNVQILRNMLFRVKRGIDPYYHVVAPMELFSASVAVKRNLCLDNPFKNTHTLRIAAS